MSNNTLTNLYEPVAMAYALAQWGNILVADNLIQGNDSGVLALSGNGNRVLRNSIRSSSYAGLDLSYGIGGQIIGNTFNGGDHGVELNYLESVLVADNNVSAGVGIYCRSVANSTFVNNTLWHCGSYGIWLKGQETNGSTLVRNRFIGNNGGLQQARDENNNSWNEQGSPHGFGNYWSDWTSPDNGSGIILLPYQISGGAEDHYPLAAPPPTAPGVPTGLKAEVHFENGTALLTWALPQNQGSSQVICYQVYRNGVMLASNVTGSSFLVTGIGAGNNLLEVRSVTAQGTSSAASLEVTIDAPPPFDPLVFVIILVVLVLAAAFLSWRRKGR
jgi:hypothetical protein